MGVFVIGLLLVIGYFILLSSVMSRSGAGRSVSYLAVILLVIYLFVVGMFLVIGQYLGSIGLLLYATAIVYSCLFAGFRIYQFAKERPKVQWPVFLTLIAYILAVLYITVFVRKQGTNFQVQMELLNWMQEEGIESFDHILLNVAMFVPLGILIPLVTDRQSGKLASGASFGMLFSVLIETGQLAMHSGTCDIDDIVSNSLGAFLGALVVWAGLRMRKKPSKDW